MSDIHIDIPYNFTPRFYQEPVIDALRSGIKRVALIFHRRAGKDKTILNWCIESLLEDTKTCFYCLPELTHARRVIWDGIDNSGFRVLDHFPDAIVADRNKSEMKITLVNGSVFQLVGADRYDALVGTNPKIIVFSEYAITDPQAWELMRPILDSPENDGVAIFISTPRGRNHFWELCKIARENPDRWFFDLKTVDDTEIISVSDLDRFRREGMSEELIQQEYYCSFEIGQEGSYYGRYMSVMEREGRIGNVRYDNNHLVYTAWDLGIGDSMVITFFQLFPDGSISIIDYYENRGYPMAHYIQELRARNEKYGYQYGIHFVPHDARHRNIITGSTFLDHAEQLGVAMSVVPSELSIMDGIEIVRGMLSRIRIDAIKCEYLIKCLLQYHAEYNDKAHCYKNAPCHDWASHACDSIRMLAIAIKTNLITRQDKEEWSSIKQKYNYYDSMPGSNKNSLSAQLNRGF